MLAIALRHDLLDFERLFAVAVVAELPLHAPVPRLVRGVLAARSALDGHSLPLRLIQLKPRRRLNELHRDNGTDGK
jgi:hypothetical protein